MCIFIIYVYFPLVADVGCVIEIYSCLRHFTIYVGHMLPIFLQLVERYWTSHQGKRMGAAALFVSPVP